MVAHDSYSMIPHTPVGLREHAGIMQRTDIQGGRLRAGSRVSFQSRLPRP